MSAPFSIHIVLIYKLNIVWPRQVIIYGCKILQCNANLFDITPRDHIRFQNYPDIFLLFRSCSPLCNNNINKQCNARLRLWPTLFPVLGCDWGPQPGHNSDIPLRTGNIWLASVLARRPCLPHPAAMYFSATRGQKLHKKCNNRRINDQWNNSPSYISR